MKKQICLAVLLLLITSLIPGCDGPGDSQLNLGSQNAVVVTINGKQITRNEMHSELMNLILTLGPQMSPGELQARRGEFELQAIQNLINTELLVAEAKLRGIKIPVSEVQQHVQLLQTSYASTEEFQRELNLRKLTEDELKKEAERALYVDRLISSVLGSVDAPGDEDVEEYYNLNREILFIPEQVNASHVLIQLLPDDDDRIREAKLKEAERLRSLIINGENFEDIAKEHSDCPSASRGGNLGWFPAERMDPVFSEAAFSLKPGDISEVIETGFGYHIIKLHDHRPRRIPELNEIKEELRQYLHDHKKRNEIQSFIENLRQKADIEINPVENVTQ